MHMFHATKMLVTCRLLLFLLFVTCLNLLVAFYICMKVANVMQSSSFACSVSQWLKQSSTCPTCRTRCTTKQLIKKLFFQDPGESDAIDPDTQQNQLETLKASIAEKG